MRQSYQYLMGVWGVLVALLCLMGCTPAEKVGSSVLAATLYGGASPGNELEQTLYLGVFDPTDQVPPTLYRVRIRGQSSSYNSVKYASGWVKANLIDSLGSGTPYSAAGKGEQDELEDRFSMQSQLFLFGPEGYMEAPRDHRLVIVMGASPEEYFKGIDTALGDISRARVQMTGADVNSKLVKALVQIAAQRDRLADLEADIAVDAK